MNRDFTVKIFEQLLRDFQSAGYAFITFADYCSFPDVGSEGERERKGEGARERGSDLIERSDDGTGERSDKFKSEQQATSISKSQIRNHKSEITNPKFIILRHDVDALPFNSLRLAQLENSLGIRGTYYFRALPHGFEEDIIRRIAALGHEIGYHYETMAQVKNPPGVKTLWNSVSSSVFLRVTKKNNSVVAEKIYPAYNLFIHNLEKLRSIAPVSTICMHGSPLSPFNNLDIWKTYDHRELGILGEPYLDTDFTRVFYLTDTGRRWDGDLFNIRDKISDGETTERRNEGMMEREREGAKERGSEGARERGNELSEGARERTIRGREGATQRGSDIDHSHFALQNTDHRLPITDYRLPITDNSLPHAPCSMPFHRTRDIIRSVRAGTFPDQAMFNLHPQRWTDARLPWLKELIWQNLKNPFKWLIIKIIR